MTDDEHTNSEQLDGAPHFGGERLPTVMQIITAMDQYADYLEGKSTVAPAFPTGPVSKFLAPDTKREIADDLRDEARQIRSASTKGIECLRHALTRIIDLQREQRAPTGYLCFLDARYFSTVTPANPSRHDVPHHAGEPATADRLPFGRHSLRVIKGGREDASSCRCS